ncbi:MAG TPA: GPW/gp25 family protein [Allosphingosinicella sp.]|nr:GPW/gp25 family protein [Allosphingosinicella sp.]
MTPGPTYLDFPFAIDTRGRAALTGEDDHVRDLIAQVLFTAPGERVNRPEFGCGVKQLVFAPASDALAAATEQLIHGALLRWLEPVISVEAVSVVVGDGALEISVTYARRETQERREEVFRQPVAV